MLTEIFLSLAGLGKNRLIVWSVLQSEFNLMRFQEKAGRGRGKDEVGLQRKQLGTARGCLRSNTRSTYNWISAPKLGKPKWLNLVSLPNHKRDWENVPNHSLLGLRHFTLTLQPNSVPVNCKTPTLVRRVRKINKVGMSKMHFGFPRVACDWHNSFTRDGSRP